MEEIWKDIPGWDGRYQASNIGRVCSLNYRHTKTRRIMKQVLNKRYYQLLLYKDGKSKCMQVHKLVALAFIPNAENKKCVDHINTITTDNRVENLRWCTHKENTNNPLTKPKMCACFKVPIIQMDINGVFLREWDSITNAANGLGVKRSPISACCCGKTRTSYGYKWKYKN